MKPYRCVLFDLDHTLWDYEANSKDTLIALFNSYQLSERGISGFRFFFENFTTINTKLWDQYDRGYINQEVIRQERFNLVFSASGLDDAPLSRKFSADYLAELPKKSTLVPQAREVLEYLHGRYPLVIITNGFEETQSAKINSAGITHFFDHVVTSQRAGHKKPAREIFDFCLQLANHTHADTLMVGDNLQTDIAGARNAGIDTAYFNPTSLPHQEAVTHEIRQLADLKKLL